jgi:hypothetical protein
LKDLPNEKKKEFIDIYRPPGIIKQVETAISAKPQIDERIMYTVPTGKLFRRGKGDERGQDKYERGMNSNMALSSGVTMG